MTSTTEPTASEAARFISPDMLTVGWRQQVLLYAALCVLVLLPVFWVTVPLLVDYPNHLARAHILHAWQNDPALQANYALNWQIAPNLAMDLIVPTLARVMSIYDAGRLFIALTLLTLIAGTLSLRWVVHREIGVWPVIVFLFLYNHALLWGFLNYLFAAGLAMLTFSAWIALRDRPAWMRVALFSLLAVVLYFSHILGLFVFGLLLFGYELHKSARKEWRRWDVARDWLVAGCLFVVPVVLFFLWLQADASTTEKITSYGVLANKMVAFMSPVLFGIPYLDIVTVLVLGIAMVLFRRQQVTFAKELQAPMWVLFAVSVIMPNTLSGVWGADFRIPTVLGCVAIAACRFEIEDSRHARAVLAAILLMIVARVGVVTGYWHDIGRQFDEFKREVSLIPTGSTMFAIGDLADAPEGKPPLYHALYWHLPTLAIIERSAFVPTLFTGHTMVKASPDRLAIDTPNGTPISAELLKGTVSRDGLPFKLGDNLSRYSQIFWIGWPENFDYVMSIRFENTENPLPEYLDRAFQGSFFDLYRVKRP